MLEEERRLKWQKARELTPERAALARIVLDEVRSGRPAVDALRRHPVKGGGYLSKSLLVAAYHQFVESGEWEVDAHLLERLRMKPMRTLSGVTTVTVLTKPYPCPGQCIFCPTDVRMPKSYLPDEPGAMRAVEHAFDPFNQVASRLEALQATGHPTEKIELLILGGTWSSYRRDYQEWFVKRCFDALNETKLIEEDGSETCQPGELSAAQEFNETALHRNVGLVIETRPDEITPKEIAWLRYLGVTKVQMGAQSLDDRILALNKRGHDAASTLRASALLRAAGFKIVLHWMPNLHGATLESDAQDFSLLWEGYCPDELKIYPNQLLANTELHEIWLRGEYTPYTTEELTELLTDIMPFVPPYCRVNRVIRDIPSTNVVAGNKRTSLRQDVDAELARRGKRCLCVRCREVRGKGVNMDALKINDLIYPTESAEEHFISYVTPDDRLAGFLRLSLPLADAPQTGLSDLAGAALIREVHVYGQSLAVGAEKTGAAQHIGLGTQLLEKAEQIARVCGFKRIAVISAVGTRLYYLDRGFERGEFYLVKSIV